MNDTMQTSTIEVTRDFAAPPERVFDAWLGKQWGAWLPPATGTCEVLSIDPRVGGTYEVAMRFDSGNEVTITGEYLAIERPRRILLTWQGSYTLHPLKIEVLCEPIAIGTRLTLVQTGFVADDMREGYRAGWTGPGGAFDKLAEQLRG